MLGGVGSGPGEGKWVTKLRALVGISGWRKDAGEPAITTAAENVMLDKASVGTKTEEQETEKCGPSLETGKYPHVTA